MNDDGSVNITLVLVSLYKDYTLRLRLTKVSAYLDKLQKHMHLQQTLQTRVDILKVIAQEVKDMFYLARAPIHFFDQEGYPIHNLDKLLIHLG